MTSHPLRIIFAGTPVFAAVALGAILDSPHHVVAVYTQPDRPAGRGLQITPSPVKKMAQHHHLLVRSPVSLKEPKEQAELANLQADLMVVAAYGLILPAQILSLPRFGCLNIHPSLLPRWRGAAPIQRTILSGESKTGVTIMQMDAGLDTGPILYQREYHMLLDETTLSLQEKLAILGSEALLHVLPLWVEGRLKGVIQDNTAATYAEKINKEEAKLDWKLSAVVLERKVRAFMPWPAANITSRGQVLRVGKAQAISAQETLSTAGKLPGTIVAISADGVDVLTGEGILRLQEVQWPGGKMLACKDFFHAKRDEMIIGHRFS